MGKQVLVAIFQDEAQADTIAQTLNEWDRLDDEVKPNAIGVLVLDEDGSRDRQRGTRRDEAVAEVDAAAPAVEAAEAAEPPAAPSS